jgi:phage-related minor tail protein
MTSSGPVQAGEAGTEAIMPLERDSSGSLGVRASVPMSGNVYVNVQAPEGSKISKKQSGNSRGDQFIDIIIEQAKEAVAGDIVSGGTGINKALEGRYGLAASKGIK